MRTLLLHLSFLEKCFFSVIYISTMLFNYIHMKMAHLPWTSPNMGSIGEVCDRLGKTILKSLVGNHWATGGLRVNSSSVKGCLIIFPFFSLRGMQCCQWHLGQTVLRTTIFFFSCLEQPKKSGCLYVSLIVCEKVFSTHLYTNKL